MCGRYYYGTGFEPREDYPNLLGITSADRMPNWTTYIKVPIREDFMSRLTTEFIIDNILMQTKHDPFDDRYEITASFQLSQSEQILKATAVVTGTDQINDAKDELTDIVVHKVKTYYERKDIKERMMNMPVKKNRYELPDEIAERFGLPTKKKETKSKWLEGIPAVKKVETYNQRVVKVTFIDDTFTKSVCSENDHFDIDVGITICLLKRVMGTNSDNATREYNKTMKYIHAVMEKNDKEKVAAQAQKAADKAKKRKIELKKAAKKLKAKEEQIDIQKQAIIRAHQEMEGQDR